MSAGGGGISAVSASTNACFGSESIGLKRFSKASVALLAGDVIGLHDLPEELTGAPPAGEAAEVNDAEALFELRYSDAITAARRLIVLRALEQTGGHQTRAAERLGVTQPYLSRLVKQLGIRRDETAEARRAPRWRTPDTAPSMRVNGSANRHRRQAPE